MSPQTSTSAEYLAELNRELTEAAAAEARAWEAAQEIDDDDHPANIAAYAANARTSAIIKQIARQSATTMQGVLVKTRAIIWCRQGKPLDTEADLHSSPGDPESDMRLLASLYADLTRLAAPVPLQGAPV